jgi:micrococcal nuclease
MKQISFSPSTLWFKTLLLSAILLISFHLHAQNTEIKITRFIDGDTVLIDDNHHTYRLRIAEIDAPEINQAYGKKSKRALMDLCKNTPVQVQLLGQDQYHRNIGKLQCNQTWVSQYMVGNGYAWFYQQYSNSLVLSHLEQEARKKNIGLWQSNNAIPPWTWRQKYKH